MVDTTYRGGGGDRMAGSLVPLGTGQAIIPKQQLVDATGAPVTIGSAPQGAYSLASNISIPANNGTAAQTVNPGGAYVWDAQFTGASIRLQSLGSDGTTWRDTATLTASGTYGSLVAIGVGTQVRLFNPNGAALTGVYSNLLQEG